MVSNSGPTDRSAAAAAASDSDATVISSRSPTGPASMAELGRTLEGRRLGAYVLEQFVGGGGMGAVFRAVDTTLDRVVAVKVLAHQQSNDEEMLRRFRNEAQSAARLDHENIGRVYAVGAEDGWHFIVFEFIEGTNLRDVVSEGGVFGLARTINVAIQIADAARTRLRAERGPSRHQTLEHHHHPRGTGGWSTWGWRGCTMSQGTTISPSAG